MSDPVAPAGPTGGGSDELGEFIALLYMVFLGLMFSYIVEGMFVKQLQPMTFFQIGFGFAIISIALVRFTSLDVTAVFIAIAGLAYNDVAIRVSHIDDEGDFWAAVIGTHTMCLFVPLAIIHIRQGIFVRKPII